jgi:hypothetical protein
VRRRPHLAVFPNKRGMNMSRTYEKLSEQQANDQSTEIINLPAVAEQQLPAQNDGWGDAAAEMNARVLRGALLKFADWKWTQGKEAAEVPPGKQFVGLGTAVAQVKWKDGKPSQYVLQESGKKLPDRNELDEPEGCGTWELGPDGKPRDPWQLTRFVYLLDPLTMETFTFSTSSHGGRNAVMDLADQIMRMRALGHPGALPIIELGSGPMPTKFGRKSKPVLKIVKWCAGNVNDARPKEIAPPSRSEEMDDEIPF